MTLQKRIDEWKKKTQRSPPDTVHLQGVNEFDSIEHHHSIIEFLPGGRVGDREWDLQFMHNLNVTLENKNRKEPLCASEYYILISADQLHHYTSIVGYYGDCEFPIDKISLQQLYNSFLDITPIPRTEEMFFLSSGDNVEKLDWYLESDNEKKMMKVYHCEYV